MILSVPYLIIDLCSLMSFLNERKDKSHTSQLRIAVHLDALHRKCQLNDCTQEDALNELEWFKSGWMNGLATSSAELVATTNSKVN